MARRQTIAPAHAPASLDRPGKPFGTSRSFYVTYLLRELRRRVRQAILIACGLGLGVGLVITVTAASTGVKDAQTAVLHSLYGVGTDLTITAPAASSPAGANSARPTSGGPGSLLIGDLGLLKATSVQGVSHLRGVTQAAGGLLLTELTQTGDGFPTTVKVDGIDLARLGLGPFVSGAIAAGRTFSPGDAVLDAAVVDARYAATNRITVGSTITVANAVFHVIGITKQPPGGSVADIYIPLARAQDLTQSDKHSLDGLVNVIFVAARSASDVGQVQAEISKLLPTATIVSSADLARAVSGSLASAANLASNLGRWVAVSTLLAACAFASILTISSITRRVRELGTLKALGWRTRRVIAQIMGEALVTGSVGALIGLAIGFSAIGVLNAVAPKLTASIPQPGGNSSSTHSAAVHLVAHADPRTIIIAIVLAITGAIIAGCLGSWRAARLQPADAFAQVQ